ncbi:MAG: hypothetical protein JWM20_576 [Patescibacteria group bacterium]|nr:hypothetical protein [Patescibacteria group bacterium]
MFSWLYPITAYAASDPISVKLLVFRISYYILNPLIKAGFVVAFVFFIWGIISYLKDRNAGRIWDTSAFDKDGKMTSKAGDQIVYGLIGLFIMVSAFGILHYLKDFIGSGIPTPY